MHSGKMLQRTAVAAVAVMFALGAIGEAVAQEKPGRAAAVAEIRAVLDAQAEAWNRGDVDGYMAGYARGDATVFVSGDTATRGWQTVRDKYAAKYDTREKMGTLTFSEVAVEVLAPDAAFVTGRWQLARKDDNPGGRFTLLLRRMPEGWRVVYDHTS